jgi:TrpR-related protein YerC/YecD
MDAASFTATHLSDGRPAYGRFRRSWHHFELVRFDGCPGFKGPDPQPVSMSGAQSRGAGAAASTQVRNFVLFSTLHCISVLVRYYRPRRDCIMKEHRALTPRQEALAERALFGAILTLRSVEECRAFFRDLCTPAELQALADRWAVVALLQQGVPYREIYKQTGVSVTTVGRVARYLTNGNGGYTLAAARLKEQRPT